MLTDPAGDTRRLRVEKSGSATTVIWNPWAERAAALADLAPDEWPSFACLETANAGANAITLASGARQSMRAIIGVE